MSLGKEFVDQRAGGIDDLRTGTVVQREGESGSGVAGGLLGSPLHRVLDLPRELAGAADVGHADIVVVHPLDVGDQKAAQQLHQEVNFVPGAAQIVLQREGVERNPGKIDARGGLHHELDALGALLVAEEALQGSPAGPAAIAVHNDGDVLGHAHRIKRVIDGTLFGRKFVCPVGAVIDAAEGRGIAHGRYLK